MANIDAALDDTVTGDGILDEETETNAVGTVVDEIERAQHAAGELGDDHGHHDRHGALTRRRAMRERSERKPEPGARGR